MENRAAMLTKVQTIEMMDVPMPVCGPGDILIRVGHVGVCGSDIHFFEDGYIGTRKVTFPMVLGHEAAGTVVAAGSEVKHLKPGDAVAVEPGIPCGTCEFCKEGRYNLCPDVVFSATPPVDGVLQRYIRFPAHMCFALPGGVSTLEGALIEPLSVGLHAAALGNVHTGQTVAILGGGCIGLMTLLACKLRDASRVIVTDLFQARLDNALAMGADDVIDASKEDPVEKILALTHGEGAHVVIETAGTGKTAYQSSFVVRRGGSIVLAGNIIGDISFNFRNMTLREADLKTVWRYRNTYPMAIDAIARKKIDLSLLKTDLFDFEDSQQAFEMAMNDKQNVVKAVVKVSK